MISDKLDKYLNKEVAIKFYDGDVRNGVLHKEEDFFNDPNKLRDGGYLLKPCYDFPYYNFHFKKSHVKQISILEKE